MTINQLNKSKTPIVKINKTLDKLAGKVLFPEKLEDANHVLKSVGLPKTKSTPRKGWEKSFKKMHENGDDKALTPDVFYDENFDA